MSRIVTIAANTVREAIRDKVLGSIALFGGLLVVVSLAMRDLSIGDTDKAVQGLALSAMAFIGAVLAVFLGVGLVWKELERKTIYTLASKPMPRWHLLLGKYVGLWATLMVELVALTAVYVAVTAPTLGMPGPASWIALAALALELTFLCAWATLFSTFAAPASAAAYTVSVYVIGHFADDLQRFGQASRDPAFRETATTLYRLVPNLEMFNLRAEAVHGVLVPAGELASIAAYGLGGTLAVLSVAVLVFERRDFS
jgi:ABC-type transport system involved in multi-copper enzyme maturation permease subunit